MFMSIATPRIEKRMSEVLKEAAATLSGESVKLRDLLDHVGEQGLLTTSLFLTLPFLVLPVSIPGVSTVFGLLIVLFAVGVTRNRVPWLPNRLMNREFPREPISRMLERGARFCVRIERMVRPRLLFLSTGRGMTRVNGLGLVVSGLLLMVPFPLVPFANTLPALAVLLLSLGILERDGLFILAGYVTIVGTVVYFSFLFAGAWLAGSGLHQLIFGAS